MYDDAVQDWKLATPEGRWAGFGPYYAMFPVSFARQIVQSYSQPGELVLDPFCGRGTTNYVAQVLGRDSIGCEVNPVGWLYARTKTDPARQFQRVLRRIDVVSESITSSDHLPENEFQEWAWCPEVLAFLNSARRQLDWKNSKVDRTLAAILLVYLHAKIGGGLSNQLRQSKSMAPEYAVRWWKTRNMKPPSIDPVEFLKSRVKWRYAKGFHTSTSNAKIHFGDARIGLNRHAGKEASLVLTSPPYQGVTNYQYDNWIRLWVLGGPAWPDWSQKQRYGDRSKYVDLLNEVFSKAAKVTSQDCTVVVRTDARQFTLETTAYALQAAWPTHKLVGRRTRANKPTQTALFGDRSIKPGEIDLIAFSNKKQPPQDYIELETGCRT